MVVDAAAPPPNIEPPPNTWGLPPAICEPSCGDFRVKLFDTFTLKFGSVVLVVVPANPSVND